jgi:CHAT domain-containing protein
MTPFPRLTNCSSKQRQKATKSARHTPCAFGQLQDALALTKGEAKRPLAVAQALHIAGMDWYEVGQLTVTETLWLQAVQAPKTEQLVRRSGKALGNLPAVRQEVALLQRFLGKQGVVVAQEDKATPERARQMAQSARVAHFACHGGQTMLTRWGRGCCLRLQGRTKGC